MPGPAEEAREEVEGVVAPGGPALFVLGEAVVAVLVVDFAGFGGGERVVGFGDLDEFLGRRFRCRCLGGGWSVGVIQRPRKGGGEVEALVGERWVLVAAILLRHSRGRRKEAIYSRVFVGVVFLAEGSIRLLDFSIRSAFVELEELVEILGAKGQR